MKDILCIIPYYDFVGGNDTLIPNHYQGMERLQKQGVDTLGIEAVYNNEPRLSSNNTVQFHVSDILWYKESLVNLAMKNFHTKYKYLMWIDSGFLLDNDWVDKSIAELEKYPLVQCFSHGVWLDTNNRETRSTNGIGYANTLGNIGGASPGGAWIMRSEIYHDDFLYDKNLVGGGDAAWALPLFEHEYPAQLCSPQHYHDYMSWVDSNETMQLDCSFITGCFYHLWHAHTENRRHSQRHELLMKHGYNPARHIGYDENGLIEYSDKLPPGLSEDVSAFFVYRSSQKKMIRKPAINPSKFKAFTESKQKSTYCLGGKIYTR